MAAGLQTLIAIGASENFRAVTSLHATMEAFGAELCPLTLVFGVRDMAFRSVLEMRFLDGRHDGRVR